MEPAKKKQTILIAAAVLVVIAIAGCAVLFSVLRGGSGAHGGDRGADSSIYIPPGEILVEDIYEGQRLIPEFKIPVNEYDVKKFKKGENGYLTYDDGKAVLGVDVSEHQHEIDWVQVRDAGISFAMLRLGNRGHTEGQLYTDETFEQNLLKAFGVGLDVGVYFFSQAVTEAEAVAEAEYVLEVLQGRSLQYPVVFDWEPPIPSEEIPAEDLRAYNCTGPQISAFAKAFCQRVEQDGYTASVYTNKSMAYGTFDLELLKDYDLWYAEYQDAPSLYYNFRMWQYTNEAEVPGIEGTVDLNICFEPYGD